MARTKICISLTQPPVKVIKDNEDDMEVIIECPYCHNHVKVGETYMNSGYVGCDNCYWGENGLMKTVMHLKENNYAEYLKGDFYKKGYKGE